MTAARIDLEDVEWWLSFRIHPRRIADHLNVSVPSLITSARRAELYELADNLRLRALDDGETLPFLTTGCGVNSRGKAVPR